MSLDSIRLPLLSASTGFIAWWHGEKIDRQRFLAHVNRVAVQLPECDYAINLCEDRYLFMVAFAAVITSNQTNLLPPSRACREIQGITAAYPNNYLISDVEVREWIGSPDSPGSTRTIPDIAADHIAAIPFTSGSTGQSRPHSKLWGDLLSGAHLAGRRFGFADKPGVTIVATVPPQHMYGLETTVMLALAGNTSVHGSRPFFPEDIRKILAEVPEPRVLITTPAHLRVCVRSNLGWPALKFIISATAPMSKRLATEVEQTFAAPLLEIYGCTEAGSVASRRTLSGELWHLYDGLTISGQYVSGSHLTEPVQLSDIIEVQGKRRFALLGRNEDQVNIAGKRSSLAHLNHILNDIDGVDDGVFFLPTDGEENIPRLTALVVAPTLSQQQILDTLAECVDPLFLPRPLIKVDCLPRNETGKLPNESLKALIESLKTPGNKDEI